MKKFNISSKKLFIFDLDGTLTPSKSPLEKDMARVLARLLESKRVAVIGGGSFEQFKKQFLPYLKMPSALFKNLFLFPTSGAAFFCYRRGWRKVYENKLKTKEQNQILRALSTVFREINYQKPKKIYGDILENRKTQITFSALGQKAPLHLKELWNKKQDLRPLIMKRLKKHIPKFEIRRGGLTSIDVTRKGIDKAYGVRQIMKTLGAKKKDIVFFGDALYPGGNDYAVLKTGVKAIQVKNPKELIKLIKLK